MPNKHNAARRHHIPKMAFGITNWTEYEAGLKQRGSLTLWITVEAIQQWKALRRTTPGGQAHYSELTIGAFLMLRTAFRMPLRQTEGLMASVLSLMGLTLKVPDHTTVSRRSATLAPWPKEKDLPTGPLHVLIDSSGLKVFGAGQWLQEKHGAKSRRGWRKLHLAVDADGFTIVAHTLTEQDVDDPSQVGPLLDQIDDPIKQATANAAYDGGPTYDLIAARDDQIVVATPPRSIAVPSGSSGPPSRRDRHLEQIRTQGRLAWQSAVGYGKRALVETMMNVYKTLVGTRLRSRDPAAQQTEAAIGVAVVNRMLAAARPRSVRREAATT
jgi:Transposase DDE domain